MRLRNMETRGDCPACGYHGAYAETAGKYGQRIGWCASCQDKAAIKTALGGAGGDSRRAAGNDASDVVKHSMDPGKAREAARVIWSGAGALTMDDPASRYLTHRGLARLIGNAVLLYRADVRHPVERGLFHALIALVHSADRRIIGVHRTYLTSSGNKARVEPQKASKGPIWGGAIRLYPAAPEIVIGEGIETSASAGLLLGLPAWAAISAGNMAKGLILPPEIRSVVIAADDDGQNAQGKNPGLDAAEAAARRWRAEGRKVRIIKPNEQGKDFNDILQARMANGGLA